MTEKALILDDSLTVRMNLADAFGEAGFQAVPCATVAEARDALARQDISVAVLDVLLPDGDGIAFLSEMRATPAGAGAAVLMLSTEAEIGDRIRGLETGADEFVGKPYDQHYVVTRARELLRLRRPETPPARPSILVIDDSLTFRETLRGMLEEAGYGVLTASDGEEGLRIAAGQRLSAVAVDARLPGIDGATVIRRIRLDTALRGLPCLLVTASDERSVELLAFEAGADAFIRKDDDAEIILANIEAMLRRTPHISAGCTASLTGARKILAVDDSNTYLQELGSALREEGYDAVLARSGEEALELLAVQPVDYILLDLIMPGLGGEETCRRIKAVPAIRDIPLIMLTAVDDPDAMLNGLGAGADDYIRKNSDLEIVKARIHAQIRRKQFEDENRRIREELLKTRLEVTEARAAQELAETRSQLVAELERKNRELEAFTYSVSHDLRAPLRSIDGFSQALLEDYSQALDETGQNHLRRVRAAAQRMGELIDDLLKLAHIDRMDLRREDVDLSVLAHLVISSLAAADPSRKMEVHIADGLECRADGQLIRIVLENLFGNAWKFTGKVDAPCMEFGAEATPDGLAYCVHDNGAGFDMAYADKLFGVFQRLHSQEAFPGTGIGLATVQRIVHRHGGRIWADSKPGEGATFRFTL